VTASGDAWGALAEPFVEGAYATVKGRVRTFVIHQQLLRHLPEPPVSVLDVGGGAGHQSFPLARLGHRVTVLDPSAAMLAKAERRLSAETAEVRSRVRLVEAPGEAAAEAVAGERFAAVLCHGVLLYQPSPEPLLDALARCVEPGGLVSVMTLNAATMAVRPALEHRWADALAGFDVVEEIGPLGVPTRADTVEDLVRLLGARHIDAGARYGVLLFSDWMELPEDGTDVDAVARVELEAGLRDPYRQLCRAFHLVGVHRPA
jgi:S-adenosylmethionine-dependent methyltransferase